MHFEVLNIVAGATLLVVGAAGVVEGGAALARRFGISPLWIGLTVVAFGTSAPELVVSGLAAQRGEGAVALGNVVGSNVLNILVVLGATALVAPVPVQRVTVRRDIRILLAITLATVGLALDGALHWGEGLLLLLATIPFMVHIYQEEKRGWAPVPEPPKGLDGKPFVLQALALGLGLVMLVVGGDRMVTGGVGIADSYGISERIVGLTIVAMGTSLPELATSLVAARRKEVDLAVGNIVGSNVLNLLLVLGAAATVGDIPVAGLALRLDMPLMVLATVLLMVFASSKHRVSRTEGGVLLGVYLAFVGLLLAGVLGQ